jgi:putative hydroxymethylpyrimidine transport system substrate-binding protein
MDVPFGFQNLKETDFESKQVMRKFIATSIIALTSIMTVSAANAADKMTVLLDWFVNPDHGPLIIAQEKGYFADAGLEVKIEAPADPSAPPKLVAAGQAELAVSYQPQLHLHISEGLPLVRVGTLVATPLSCLLVLKDGPIKTPADLKGKKVGYSVAGVEEALLGTVLGTHGVKLDDIEMINVNFSLSPALMSGQVEAVIGAFRNFELNQMDIEKEPGRCFYIEEEGVPAYDELIYVANPKTMDKAKLAKFMKATELATQFIVNNPEESWEIFSATSKELQNELNRRAWLDTIPRFALRPAAYDAGRYQDFQNFLMDAGLIMEIQPISKIAVDVSAK